MKAPVYCRAARLRAIRQPVVDIGLGGVRIYSDDPFKIGERLDVELYMPDGAVVRGLVRVAWLNELPAGSPARYDVGLELLDLGSEGRERLVRVLEDEGEPVSE